MFIREPAAQTKASKILVHCQIQALVDFRKLPRFLQTREHRVTEVVNTERPALAFASCMIGNLNQRHNPVDDLPQVIRANHLFIEERLQLIHLWPKQELPIASGQFSSSKLQ